MEGSEELGTGVSEFEVCWITLGHSYPFSEAVCTLANIDTMGFYPKEWRQGGNKRKKASLHSCKL